MKKDAHKPAGRRAGASGRIVASAGGAFAQRPGESEYKSLTQDAWFPSLYEDDRADAPDELDAD